MIWDELDYRQNGQRLWELIGDQPIQVATHEADIVWFNTVFHTCAFQTSNEKVCPDF